MSGPQEPEPSRWELPDPAEAGPDDVVAIGGDLEPGTVLDAYPRGVIPLDGFHRSRSLRGTIPRFEVRVNRAFEAVIRGCADPAREHGWIDESFVAAYCRLHELGWAHSVETWVDGALAGGLYGLRVAGCSRGSRCSTAC